jgi:hypothetical protein
MANNQVSKKRRAGKGRRSLAKHLRRFNPDHLALPQEEIRRLAMHSTTGYRIEPFVGQMVRVMDNLKAGRIRKVAALTASKRDKSRATLIAAISNAAREGNTMAAHETAFLAALYAYENSLDHLRAFMRYLNNLRETNPRSRRAGSKLR